MRGNNRESTYPPLNTLKCVTQDIWIVDGPLIWFGFAWPKMPFPTRMTVIRLGDGSLFLHSPTPLTPDLIPEIAKLGVPRWLIAPNRIHYWWIPDWKTAFPNADVFLPPRVREQAGTRINFPFSSLDRDTGYPWDDEIATIPVAGSYMTEVDFFHRSSRTLILADLIENFEPDKLSMWMRLLARLGGCLDPHGAMPRDLRWTFSKQRAEFRAAVETMISLDPERVILAHGRWYAADGTSQLKRAFQWLLT